MTSKLKSMLGGAAFAALLIVPAAADTDWTSLPQKSFDVHSVKVDSVVGTLTVNVKDKGPVTVDVSGAKERVHDIDMSSDGGRLVISGTRRRGRAGVGLAQLVQFPGSRSFQARRSRHQDGGAARRGAECGGL